MPFYTFRQNNSGGGFDGPHYVIIEADTAQQANDIAVEKTSIYFCGVGSGQDCRCCGDRWWTVEEYDANPEPMIYKEPIMKYKPLTVWSKDGDPAEVHYLNGKVEHYRIHKDSVELV